jgi:hypothetical protein
MKWAHFNYQGQPRYGLLNGTTIQLTGHTWLDILAGKPATLEGEIAQEEVTLLNPVGRPGKIVCVGLNYLESSGMEVTVVGFDEPLDRMTR